MAANLLIISFFDDRPWILLIIFLLALLIQFLKINSYDHKFSYLNIIFLVILTLIIFKSIQYKKALETIDIAYPEGRTISLSGRIESIKLTQYGTSISLKSDQIPLGKCLLVADFLDESKFYAGVKVKVKGEVKRILPAMNEGCFNPRQYASSQGQSIKIKADGQLEIEENASFFYRLANKLKLYCKNSLDKELSKKDAGLMQTILLSDKSQLDQDTYLLYQEAGISHLLAVSGLHISIIILAFYKFLKKISLSHLAAMSLSIIFLAVYLIITSGSISAKRAGLMCIIYILSQSLGRSMDLMTSLSLASIVLLIENPYVALNVGFQFSFLALCAIAILKPVLMAYINPLLDNMKENFYIHSEKLTLILIYFTKRFTEAFSISLSIIICTLPLIAYNYYQTSLITIIVNLIVIPLMTLCILSAIMGLLLMPINLIISRFILATLHYILLFYEFLSKIVIELDLFKIYFIRPDIKTLLIYYSILLLFCLISLKIQRLYKLKIINFKLKKSRIEIPLTIFFIIILILKIGPSLDSKAYMRSLYVGQGDCHLIGDNKTSIMVDCGSSSIENLAKSQIEPCLLSLGIRSIDYAFISHSDMDHISGYLSLLSPNSKIKIKKILIADLDYSQDKNMLLIIDAANASNTPIYYLSANSLLNLSNEFRLKYLYPSSDRETNDGESQNRAKNENSASSYSSTDYSSGVYPNRDYSSNDYSRNDYSSVFMLEYKDETKILFTGDAGFKTEENLLSNYDNLKADILKVGHHGSASSSSEAFLEKVMPDIGLISAGINNIYGHPSQKVLERYEKMGIKVRVTKDEGEIKLKIGNKVPSKKT